MIEPDGFLTRFQAFEYALGFRIGRRSLADFSITSGVSLYRRDALECALQQHSLSVYAEDLENALILLSAGERIYYDGRLVVSTEGPGSWRRWFSQRVGWYHGLIKVYTERFPEIRRVGGARPSRLYHYIIYMGVLTLGLHLVKVLSVLLLFVSLAAGLDHLFAAGLLAPQPAGQSALFRDRGRLLPDPRRHRAVHHRAGAERAYVAPIVPLYLLYTLIHVVPMTVGYANWVTMKLWGRRLYRDHYEPGDSRDALHEASSETAMVLQQRRNRGAA